MKTRGRRKMVECEVETETGNGEIQDDETQIGNEPCWKKEDFDVSSALLLIHTLMGNCAGQEAMLTEAVKTEQPVLSPRKMVGVVDGSEGHFETEKQLFRTDACLDFHCRTPTAKSIEEGSGDRFRQKPRSASVSPSVFTFPGTFQTDESVKKLAEENLSANIPFVATVGAKKKQRASRSSWKCRMSQSVPPPRLRSARETATAHATAGVARRRRQALENGRICTKMNNDSVDDKEGQEHYVNMYDGLANSATRLSVGAVVFDPRAPYRPSLLFQYPRTTKGRWGRDKRSFQHAWFRYFTWLHYDVPSDSAYCHTCLLAFAKKSVDFKKYFGGKGAFYLRGFTQWHKARERMEEHQRSKLHQDCHRVLYSSQQAPGAEEVLNGVTSSPLETSTVGTNIASTAHLSGMFQIDSHVAATLSQMKSSKNMESRDQLGYTSPLFSSPDCETPSGLTSSLLGNPPIRLPSFKSSPLEQHQASSLVSSVSHIKLEQLESSTDSLTGCGGGVMLRVGNVEFSPKGPMQPGVDFSFPRTKFRTFQPSWFESFPWLHYDIPSDSAFCHSCLFSYANQLVDFQRYPGGKGAFYLRGFSQWQKARERMEDHQRSRLHQEAERAALISKSSAWLLKAMLFNGSAGESEPTVPGNDNVPVSPPEDIVEPRIEKTQQDEFLPLNSEDLHSVADHMTSITRSTDNPFRSVDNFNLLHYSTKAPTTTTTTTTTTTSNSREQFCSDFEARPESKRRKSTNSCVFQSPALSQTDDPTLLVCPKEEELEPPILPQLSPFAVLRCNNAAESENSSISKK